MGVLVFEGMKFGFLEGDLTKSIGENGDLNSEAILTTSYNVLPIWLRIAHDNVSLAKAAFEALTNQWNDDPELQKSLLLAELSPSVQTFVACGIAFDALYEQLRPFAKISDEDIKAWKKNKTPRSAQIIEITRRVYKIQGVHLKEIKKVVKETTALRDNAVHPNHALKRTMERPDIPVGVDWRFCAYRYENASTCYSNAIDILLYLYEKGSPDELVNENMENIFRSLREMGLADQA